MRGDIHEVKTVEEECSGLKDSLITNYYSFNSMLGVCDVRNINKEGKLLKVFLLFPEHIY